MSYTLIGRIESRLVSVLPALARGARAAALVGARARRADARDRARARHRTSTTACSTTSPAGSHCRSARSSSALVYGAMRWLGIGAAPLGARRCSRSAGSARSCSATRVFPRLRLEYARRRRRARPRGALTAVAVGGRRRSAASARLRGAPADRPPARHHPGPARDPPRADARRTAIVRGGILIRAGHVTLRNVTVVGGENGIDVRDARPRDARQRARRRRRASTASTSAAAR